MRLGLLFLARRGVSQLDAWEAWRAKSRLDIVFLVHDKSRVARPGEAYRIATRVATQYGAPSIVRAELELLKEAVKTGCTHCVLVSGDTLPLHAAEDVMRRIYDAPITITQFGTSESLERELWTLFDAMGLACDHLAYHHQFFAMTRVAMDAVVSDEERLLGWIERAHATSQRLGFGFCTDELWLNFVLHPRKLSRLVYFEPSDDRGRVNPPLTRQIRRMWPFARKFDASFRWRDAPWELASLR